MFCHYLLDEVWCEWIEMELRHREYDEALKARWRRKIAVVLLFRGSGFFVGRNMMKEVFCQILSMFVIISCHILSCRYWLDDFGKQRYSYPCFFLCDARKAVAAGSQTSNRTEEGCSPQGGQGRFPVLRCVFQSHQYNTSFRQSVLLTSDGVQNVHHSFAGTQRGPFEMRHLRGFLWIFW